MKFLLRLGLAVSLAVSAASHAYLYIHGYQHIPMIGTAFLIQASVSFSLALLIIANGSLVAFVLSRTIGLFGFSERGWDPSPHAAITVAAEVLCVLLWAAGLVRLPRPRSVPA